MAQAQKHIGFNLTHQPNTIKVSVYCWPFLWYNSNMYLSKLEQEKIIAAYDCENLIENNHYQVEPDTWIYLFCDKNDKKYVLIDADDLDFDFEIYPHLLRFDNDEFKKLDLVIQREIPVKDGHSRDETSGTFLFEYTD